MNALAIDVAAAVDPAGQLTGSTRSMAESVGDALPRIGVAVAVILVGYGLSRAVRWGLRRALVRRQTQSFATVMSKLAGWVLFAIAIAVAATVSFPSVKPVDLLAGLGFFSVAVGFAFQDILENTLSGVLLLLRQPFESGDQIEVQEQSGTVEAITIRETRIKTYDGQLVLIPNRDVYKSVIVVHTHFDSRRWTFEVGIAYENDATEACRLIAGTLAAVDGVSADREPEAFVHELGVSTVDIEARFWCDPNQHEGRRILDAAIRSVKAALDDAGIEMPADVVALQATPSFQAAIQGSADLTPAGSVARRGSG